MADKLALFPDLVWLWIVLMTDARVSQMKTAESQEIPRSA